MSTELVLTLDGIFSLDELDKRVRSLVAELRSQRFQFELIPIGVVNANAKGIGASEVGQIAMALAASGGVLVTLISAIKEWLMRQPVGTKIRVKLGESELELSGPFSNATEQLVRDFVAQAKSN